MRNRFATSILRRALPLLVLAGAGLLGGCVYDPYSGGYAPGVVAAPYPAYGYGYGYPAVGEVVIGGGDGGYYHHGWGGWRR